jgi:hypothetical protein
MTTLEIKNSTAISKIEFNLEKSIVGICYTSNPEKLYEFHCDNLLEVKENLYNAHEKGESIGKLIHSYKKDGTFEVINVDESLIN